MQKKCDSLILCEIYLRNPDTNCVQQNKQVYIQANNLGEAVVTAVNLFSSRGYIVIGADPMYELTKSIDTLAPIVEEYYLYTFKVPKVIDDTLTIDVYEQILFASTSKCGGTDDTTDSVAFENIKLKYGNEATAEIISRRAITDLIELNQVIF